MKVKQVVDFTKTCFNVRASYVFTLYFSYHKTLTDQSQNQTHDLLLRSRYLVKPTVIRIITIKMCCAWQYRVIRMTVTRRGALRYFPYREVRGYSSLLQQQRQFVPTTLPQSLTTTFNYERVQKVEQERTSGAYNFVKKVFLKPIPSPQLFLNNNAQPVTLKKQAHKVLSKLHWVYEFRTQRT